MINLVANKAFKDEEAKALFLQQLLINKLKIFSLCIPTEKNTDIFVITKCLQIIQKMLEFKPKALPKESIQTLLNLVHFKNQQVREEVGELLLQVSDDFGEDLLELQKINPSKGSIPDDFKLNFNE